MLDPFTNIAYITRMRILLSNDDGVHADGLAALIEALSAIADLDVVAPDRDRSGASNSLTFKTPLRPQVLRNGAVSLEGTPTDCVHMALRGYLKKKPDLVVSGINHGANLGDDVLYSGTVAAAMEARILGIPSIAVSLVDPTEYHFDTAGAIAKQLVERVVKDPLPANTILNVNVPDLPLEKIRGIEVVRLGVRHSAGPMVKMRNPYGQMVYWVGPAGPGADADLGTDFHAVASGCVAVTPLQVDLTNYVAFEKVAQWVTGLTAN